MRQARTVRPQPATAGETAAPQGVEAIRSKSEGADLGDALARAETFGHRFADLSVQPIQRKGGKGKGKGKKKPQRQAPRRAPEPVAPQDDRNVWRRNMPYLLGGTAPHENRGYFGRILPSILGGQPVPGAQGVQPQVAEEPPAVDEEVQPEAHHAEEEAAVLEDPVVPDPEPVKPKKKKAARQRQPEPLPEPKPAPKPAPKVEPIDLDLGGPKSKAQKARERKARRREEEEARLAQIEEDRVRQEALRLQATRRLPRRVIRHDRDFASRTNNRGQGKAYRVGQDLRPAGDIAVTATEQLHQDSPNKGRSNRISFASQRAADANDYSRGGRDPSVQFKFRKWQRARIKGKGDAQGFRALSTAEVLDGIRNNGTKDQQRSARNFANKDGEHQTVGRVPARFLQWQGQAPGGYDSDSDDELTDDEA